MTREQLMSKLNQYRRGTYIKLTWKSDLPVSAKFKGTTVEKITTGIVRLGVQFANLKSTREREIPVGPMTWGEFVNTNKYPELSPLRNVLIEYNGNDYVRVTKSNNKRLKPNIQYLLNGKSVSEEELKAMNIVLPSYWSKNTGENIVFNIKLDNVIQIWK